MKKDRAYSIMVHGGAGALDKVKDSDTATHYLESVHSVLEQGRKIMEQGGSALQTVETCASLLEDNPLFNAGCGSVLNENGQVEMDAAIMDGRNLKAGAVAGVQSIANPIQLARLVMSETEHVMLVAEGAMAFADQHNMKHVPESYFYIPDRVEQLKQAQLENKIILDHEDAEAISKDQKYGTIGAIALDPDGNLAAATSTGGMVNKHIGRVGDTPIIGAGVYADNETCAVSATGYGEDFMRTVIAKTIADFIYLQKMDAQEAVEAGIKYLTRKVKGRGGVIVIDRNGQCSRGFTTRRMIHGYIEHAGKTICGF